MKEIAVEAGESPLAAGVMFIDSGITFNPQKTKESDTKLSAERSKIGGLGMNLVKN